jgi:hypothetical protein
LPEDVLTPWEKSVARCSGVATSAGREATPRREKGEDDVSWADANLTVPKNKENACNQFSCYKWTVKI